MKPWFVIVWLAGIAVWWTTGLLWGTLVAAGLAIVDLLSTLILLGLVSENTKARRLGQRQTAIPSALHYTFPVLFLWLIVGIVWTAVVHL